MGLSTTSMRSFSTAAAAFIWQPVYAPVQFNSWMGLGGRWPSWHGVQLVLESQLLLLQVLDLHPVPGSIYTSMFLIF